MPRKEWFLQLAKELTGDHEAVNTFTSPPNIPNTEKRLNC